jgi:hypothetical protein
MNLTTIAVDLAKDVFQVGVADRQFKIVERHRLSRSRFARFLRQRERSQRADSGLAFQGEG